MAIRAGKIASVPDDGNTTKIQPSEMNPFTEPIPPQEQDLYYALVGTPPAAGSSITLRIYIGGAWVDVFTTSY